jgi:hypothetical protein
MQSTHPLARCHPPLEGARVVRNNSIKSTNYSKRVQIVSQPSRILLPCIVAVLGPTTRSYSTSIPPSPKGRAPSCPNGPRRHVFQPAPQHQTTNLGVRSSNLFGRARNLRKYSAFRVGDLAATGIGAHRGHRMRRCLLLMDRAVKACASCSLGFSRRQPRGVDPVSTFSNHATFVSSSVDASSNGMSRLAISHRLAGDALQVAHHSDRRVDSCQDLRLSLRPLLAHKLPLPIEIFAHVCRFRREARARERHRHCSDGWPESA